jgi:hypothetical protein
MKSLKVDGRSLPHDTSEMIRRWAVRRVKAGELKPLVLEKPYRVRLCLRRQFVRDAWVLATVGRLEGMTADGGPGCFAYTSDSAEAVGNLLNEIEWTVLKP